MAIFGDTLRQARAYKGVTLKEAEQATRINRHHLAALEDENFGALPPLIYQRGIVRNYATYLDLDPSKLLAMFEEAHGSASDAEVVAAVKPLDMPNHWAPNFAIIAFMVVMSAIVFAWLYSAYFAPTELAATTAPNPPTVTAVPTEALGLPSTAEASPTSKASPSPTPKPKATKTPEPTDRPKPPTETPVPPTETPETEAVVQQETVAQAEEPVDDQQQTTLQQGEPFTMSITAGSDIYLTISVDGQVWFSGWLGAGQSTGQFTAAGFYVETSDFTQTLITNHTTGASGFTMGSNAFYLAP